VALDVCVWRGGGGGLRRAAAGKRAVMRISESYWGSCKSKGEEWQHARDGECTRVSRVRSTIHKCTHKKQTRDRIAAIGLLRWCIGVAVIVVE
jgi:hypothetical protein